MERKYETVPEEGMLRIRAVRGFGNVKAGDSGGLIEKESNLSHHGNAWVSGDARVYGDAWVYGNARVFGKARVSGDARVFGNAKVRGDAKVSGNAWISGNARVSGDAEVYGNARVFGDAEVFGNAWVSGDAWVSGGVQVFGNAWVSGDARVYGNAGVSGSAQVSGKARVSGASHVLTVGPCEFGTVTVFRTDTGHLVSVGCQSFTIDRIDDVAADFNASPLTVSMLAGFKAMVAPLIASWHEEE